uniref:Mitochondrial import inner membrane translocase subunit n=1 Tax=Strigamia maritima TaxID=126957 RepID=T1JKM0_STRMM
MDTLDASKLSHTQKAEIMHHVQKEIAVASTQQLLTKMSEKCFPKCVSRPGTTLYSSEQV